MQRRKTERVRVRTDLVELLPKVDVGLSLLLNADVDEATKAPATSPLKTVKLSSHGAAILAALVDEKGMTKQGAINSALVKLKAAGT